MNIFTQCETDNYARVLVWAVKKARDAKFKKYDNILLRYDADSEPLATAVHKILTEEKFNVTVRVFMAEEMSKNFYTSADDAQIKYLAAGEREFNENINGSIAIFAPRSLTYLKDVNPQRLALSAAARRPLKKILDNREQMGVFGWTLCNYPSAACAEHAGLSLKEYAAQIKKACYLDEKDPVAKWEETTKHTAQICKELYSLKIEQLFLQSDDTDLSVLLGDNRRFLGGRGCNIPSFEIFTSPHMNGVNGVYYADMPSYRSGVLCKGIRLHFKDGRVIKASADAGEKFVKEMIAMDEGSSRLGEFSLTDKRFSKIDRFMANTLYDENFGGKHGNSHIALGQSFADAYSGDQKTFDDAKKKALGFNESSLHWDLINTQDKIVRAKLKGGKSITIYENGQFKF